MISLGDRVRDVYTKFEGVATGRSEWLYGCTRFHVEPTELREGKPIEPQWFDEQRLEVVRPDAPTVTEDSQATTGGPQSDPCRVRDPSR